MEQKAVAERDYATAGTARKTIESIIGAITDAVRQVKESQGDLLRRAEQVVPSTPVLPTAAMAPPVSNTTEQKAPLLKNDAAGAQALGSPGTAAGATGWIPIGSAPFKFHTYPSEVNQCNHTFCGPIAVMSPFDEAGSLKESKKTFLVKPLDQMLVDFEGLISPDEASRATELIQKEMAMHVTFNSARMYHDPAMCLTSGCACLECPWQWPIAPWFYINSKKVMTHPQVQGLASDYYHFSCQKRFGSECATNCTGQDAFLDPEKMSLVMRLSKARLVSQLDELFQGRLRFDIKNEHWHARSTNGGAPILVSATYKLVVKARVSIMAETMTRT